MTSMPAPQPKPALPETEPHASADSVSLQLSSRDPALPDSLLAEGEDYETLLGLMSDGLFYELGLSVPRLTHRHDPDAKPRDFRVLINGEAASSFQALDPSTFLVNGTVERLTLLKIPAEPSVNPANGSECAVARDEDGARKRCEQEGLTTWSPAGYLILQLSGAIRLNAARLLSVEQVELNLLTLEQWFPDLVAPTRRRFGISLITGVLRQLLEEEISIRDLRGILESLLTVQGVITADQQLLISFFPYPTPTHLVPALEDKPLAELNTADYAVAVRMGMKRYISHKYTRGQGSLFAFLVDPVIETRIANVEAQPLDDEERKRLSEVVRAEVRFFPKNASQPVIMTTPSVRRKLWELLHDEFPRLAVVAYQELDPDLNIQPLARITFQLPSSPAPKQ